MHSGKAEEIWGAKVVGCLFLTGLGSGAFGMAAAFDLITGGQPRDLTSLGAWIGSLSVGAGVVFLTRDLGVPRRFFRLARYRATPILSAFMLLAAVTVAVSVFSWNIEASAFRVLMVVVIISAFATSTYVGFVLAKIKCRPFWNTPMLPLLIVVSSLVWGIGALSLVGSIVGSPMLAEWTITSPKSSVIGALGLQLVIMAFYVVAMDGSRPEAKLSVHRLTRGDLALLFWGGVVPVGMVLPLGMSVASPAVPEALVAALILAGGFSLCHCVLAAGARSLLPGESRSAAFVR